MKKLTSLLLICLLAFSLTIPAYAGSVIVIPDYAGAPPKIVDDAKILTSTEEATLETQAQKLADQYQIDVVILTMDSLYGQDITEYADD